MLTLLIVINCFFAVLNLVCVILDPSTAIFNAMIACFCSLCAGLLIGQRSMGLT